jgi:GT2 family glycosyltransferase
MPNGQHPFVSIVTLHFNQLKATQEFLESSRTLTYPGYEIILCDMHSTYNPEREIRSRRYPNLKYFRCDQNLGFAGGNNWGLRKAAGDFIFFVNNDTILNPEIIQILLQPMLENANIAGVSPKIKYFDKPAVIQYAGFTKMNMITGRAFPIGQGETDRGQYNDSRSTSAVHGCAMMVRRSVTDRIGMFPEKFFLYYEEWDWSNRAIEAGYSLWYEGKGQIQHKESLSVGRENPLKTYYLTRNRILFMRRNATEIQYMLFLLFFFLVSIPKAVLQCLVHGRFREIGFITQAVIWNLRNTSFSPVSC